MTYKVGLGFPIPMGVWKTSKGINFSVDVAGDKTCSLLLYKKGEAKPELSIPFLKEHRAGSIYTLLLEGFEYEDYEYNYLIDEVVTPDPYGKEMIGLEEWGKEVRPSSLRCRFHFEEYSWEGDTPLYLPFSDVIMYKIHPRGFTKHSSSKVKSRGTFQGIIEKIPYLKELGVNQIELMPSYEFLEKQPVKEFETELKLNYWGYTRAFYFAPKSSYSSQNNGIREFKNFVKNFHQNGIEIIMEFYFPKGTGWNLVLDCLRYWVMEYHIDGVHVMGEELPLVQIVSDPVLRRTKIICEGLQMNQIQKEVYESLPVHIGDYSDGFLTTARRFLKGDEEQLKGLIYRIKRNSDKQAVINYITSHNGFTLMDLVSYDVKHNEGNGEDGRDGNNYNYSWNCGAEGPTQRKKVLAIRRKQIKNAFMLLLLSQGVPMILSGDEMGNSQSGNNNAYCQDNAISWINWNDKNKNQDIFLFVKKLIEFRRRHPILHKKEELRGMDYLSCGYPDLSYHGEKAWYTETENYLRHIGVMYCGKYARIDRKKEDDFLYVAYNSYWLERSFALPKLPTGMKWRIAINTSITEDIGIYEPGEEPVLEEQKYLKVNSRTIMVLVGR